MHKTLLGYIILANNYMLIYMCKYDIDGNNPLFSKRALNRGKVNVFNSFFVFLNYYPNVFIYLHRISK